MHAYNGAVAEEKRHRNSVDVSETVNTANGVCTSMRRVHCNNRA
jgi:hypothetical protein